LHWYGTVGKISEKAAKMDDGIVYDDVADEFVVTEYQDLQDLLPNSYTKEKFWTEQVCLKYY